MSKYKRSQWEVVPYYVVFAERIFGDPDADPRLYDELSRLRENETNRWKKKRGLFHCSYCGHWKPADEVYPSHSNLNFFICDKPLQRCEAVKMYRDEPELYMERGWYPAMQRSAQKTKN